MTLCGKSELRGILWFSVLRSLVSGFALSPPQRLLRGWGRWIGEKEGPLGTTFPARFLLPSPQPPNCLHGQARKRPLWRREGFAGLVECFFVGFYRHLFHSFLSQFCGFDLISIGGFSVSTRLQCPRNKFHRFGAKLFDLTVLRLLNSTREPGFTTRYWETEH